jgi:threonine/homoserine/homoserine lactone efflux protein
VSELIDTAAGSTWPVAVLRVVVGGVLIIVAVRKFLRRPRADDEPSLPAWMRSIESRNGAQSLRLGLVLTVANPKEIAFAAGAGLTIGGAFLPAGQLIGLGAVFVVLACLSVAIPVFAVAVAGERVMPALHASRTWLVENNAIVMSIVLLIIGAMLLGSGVSALAG